MPVPTESRLDDTLPGEDAVDSTSPGSIDGSPNGWPDGWPDDWSDIDTPAFVYDTRVVRRLLTYTDGLRQASGCKVLFSLKPFAYVDALALMAPHLDGFATSSLFEARLASQVLLGHGSLHLTTPGLRPDDVGEIASLCDFVSFNSLSQYRMHGEAVSRASSCGLRVNPQMSFVDDERYDPCRPNSKLGVPLERLVEVLEREPHRLSGIDGILVHSNCDSSDVAQAQATVQYLHAKLGGLFERVQWVNLGGGYLFDEAVWGNGLASEVVGGLVGWARSQPRIQTLTGGVTRSNPASARVLAKNGFELIGGLDDAELIYQLSVSERDTRG